MSEIPLYTCSARVHLGTPLLVLEQGLLYKLNVHLRLNVLYDVLSFTKTELGCLHVGNANGPFLVEVRKLSCLVRCRPLSSLLCCPPKDR